MMTSVSKSRAPAEQVSDHFSHVDQDSCRFEQIAKLLTLKSDQVNKRFESAYVGAHQNVFEVVKQV